ncbi:hypothetical protein [Pyxidicoccus sp. MSG2]|uniref:hypothetical protein n=1 Tax=Pyxidicoccus sp. MSG2 TaxID=2996790 RepID=UPI00226E96E2|nr:hypothetical protein [Pyxidicoccus sp. MSG2]MCY1017056.1 hypothetical protein [Pyxidicoccus sp. MSG2]
MQSLLRVLLALLLPALSSCATGAPPADDAGVPDAGARLEGPRALQVRVLGPDGVPLPGSHVQVVSESLDATNVWLQTNDRGEAGHAAPPPGRYRVLAFWVEKEQFQRYAWQDFESGPGTDDLRMELRFPQRSATPISGRVRRLDGQPVAGATVEAWQHFPSVPLDGDLLRNTSAPRELATATTDAEGRFTLEPFREGEYGLHIQHQEGLGDATARTGGPAPDIVLAPRCVRSAAGRVVDEQGTPLKSFEVGSRRVRDAKGRFQLGSTCFTHIESAGFVSQELPLLGLKSLHAELPDIVLERGRPLTGRVVGPDGKPVESVDLRASWNGARGGADSTSTDASGRFSLGPVPVGREVALWTKWDDRLLRQRIPAGKDGKVEVQFPSEDSRLEVLVRDARGAPLAGMNVMAEGTWGLLTLRTDGAGRAVHGVPAGSYEVRATHKPSMRRAGPRVPYRFAPVRVEVSPENSATVVVQASQGAGRLRVLLPESTHYDAIFVVPGAHDWPADIPGWVKLVEHPLIENMSTDMREQYSGGIIYYESQNDFSELVPGPYTIFARNPRDDGPGLLLYREVVQVDGRGRQVVQVRFEGDGSRRLPEASTPQ